jgi:hypothetical protein
MNCKRDLSKIIARTAPERFYYITFCGSARSKRLIKSLLLTAFVLALWITFLAVYRTIISGFKRDFALFLALRANCLVHLPWPAESTTTTLISHVSSHSYGHQILRYIWVPFSFLKKDLALSCDYRAFKKDCKCFFISLGDLGLGDLPRLAPGGGALAIR